MYALKFGTAYITRRIGHIYKGILISGAQMQVHVHVYMCMYIHVPHFRDLRILEGWSHLLVYMYMVHVHPHIGDRRWLKSCSRLSMSDRPIHRLEGMKKRALYSTPTYPKLDRDALDPVHLSGVF